MPATQKRPVTKRLVTIGQTALLFCSRPEQAEFDLGIDPGSIPGLLFFGSVSKIPEDVAAKVAQLHPNFSEYYEDALMVLYQGEGQFKSGTEDPVRALKSYGGDLPYVVIWRPLVTKELIDT